MLIVDGPDLVGKTTLCKRIVKEMNLLGYPAVYTHFSRLPDAWDYCWDYRPYVTRYAVMDRFHLSELCYGVVTRGHCKIVPSAWRLIESWLMAEASYQVLVNANAATIEREYAKRGDEMFPLSTILAVRDKFDAVGLLAKGHEFGLHVDQTYRHSGGPTWPSSNEELVESICKGWDKRLTGLTAREQERR